MHTLQVIVIRFYVTGGAAFSNWPYLQRHLQSFGNLRRDVILDLEYMFQLAVITL